MTTIERVVRRYRVAAMDEAKMDALLQKIRKGATASLNWSQLGEVFQVLVPGWKLEKTVGFVKVHGIDGDEPNHFWETDRDRVEKRYEELKKDLVPSLPATAKVGRLYVTELSGITPSHNAGFMFKFKAYLGNEAWRIVTPDGKEKLVLPSKFDVGDGSGQPKKYEPRKAAKISIYEILSWLKKETNFIDDVNAKLGLEAHEVVTRTRDGTGTCPVCFQNVKITNGRDIVLHGYKRPGTGETHGNCFGYRYPAFELSDEGCKEYLKKELEVSLVLEEKVVKHLKSGDVDKVTLYRRDYNKGDPGFDSALQTNLEKAEDERDFTLGMIEAFKRLIQKWEIRPLPKEGERKIDWFSQGQK